MVIALNVLVSTAFAESRKFWYGAFFFIHLTVFSNLPVISLLTHRLFRSILFNFHIFANFSISFCFGLLISFNSGQKTYLV